MTIPPFLVDEFIDRPYGEPLFHTESEVAALCYGSDNTLWSIEEAGILRQWAPDGRFRNRHYLSDLETMWAFSPDARLLASSNEQVVLWDVASAKPKHHFSLPEDCWVLSLCFSHDGKLLAGGDEDGQVRIWNVQTKELVAELDAHKQSVFALAFRPDGKVLATAGDDRLIQLWDVDTKKSIQTLVSHSDRIPALVWHPKGDLLISAGWDTTARVWQPPRPDPLMLLNTHSDQVHTLAYSPDGSLLATADSDFGIHVWSDPKSAKARYVLNGHSEEIRCMAFSPDNLRLATAGADRIVHIWDMRTGQLLAGPNPRARHGIALIDCPENHMLVSTAGTVIHGWDLESAEPIWTPNLSEPVVSVAASPDGKLLATSTTSPDVQIWDIATRGPKTVLSHTKGPISALTFSADSKYLATASVTDGLVWLWKMGTPEAILVIPEAADASTLETIAFHPNNKWLAVGGMDWLATGGSDGAVCIWDLEARDKLMTFSTGVTSLAFDPAGRYLAGGSITQTVILWDLSLEKKIFELPGHQDRIGAVLFSPDGSWLVSASDDSTVRVWNVLSGALAIARQFDSAIQSLAFSPDGKYLYTGNGNTTCYRLEMRKLMED
jgi:WD40 repeat protein